MVYGSALEVLGAALGRALVGLSGMLLGGRALWGSSSGRALERGSGTGHSGRALEGWVWDSVSAL